MRPYQAFHALEILRNSFSVPLRRKGVVLSHNDNQTVLDVYQQWLLLLLDLGYLHPETLYRDARRLWTDLIHNDVLSTNSCFAECLQSVRLQDFKGFKGLCSGVSTHLFALLRSDSELCAAGDVFAAKRLMQAFAYTSRLSLNDIDLTQQLLDSYLAVEEAIPEQFDESLVRPLNEIIRGWIGKFLPYPIRPHHGPGGIAEHGRCSLEEKYKLLNTDLRLNYAFGEPLWLSGSHATQQGRVSRTIFVPKSYKTFRTISMEPATLQYFQQGVWGVIDRLVSASPYLRNHIDFHDETRNMRYAQIGSYHRSYATIDLSAASDSVSYSLVKKLFRGTWLLRYLVATRSTETLLPDGRIIKLRKFAPMGSALCFPVETIIFASICEYVAREHRVTGRYSVFGDDIIVPTICVEDTIRILEQLGFVVNHDKSFVSRSCWFRESCGGEFVNGSDVTPMRVSRKYASREDDVRLTGLISSANNAYLRQYRNLRYFFLRKLRAAGYTPLFSPTSLLSDNYTNYHTKRRWNIDLQRVEVRASALSSRTVSCNITPLGEEIRLRHWFESTLDRYSIGDGFESVISKSMVQLRDTWQMKPFEGADQPFIDSMLGGGLKPAS